MQRAGQTPDHLSEALSLFQRLEDELASKLLSSSSTKVSLQKLIIAGMPQSEIMRSLLFISRLPGEKVTFRSLVNCSPREFRKGLKALINAAHFIDVLADAQGWHLLDYCFPPLPCDDLTARQLNVAVSEYLRIAADRLKKQAEFSVGKPEDYGAIAQFIAQVWEQTRKPHYEQVATLLNRVTDGFPSTEALKMWCQRHKELINSMRRNLHSTNPNQT
jgi:hypothetical protein